MPRAKLSKAFHRSASSECRGGKQIAQRLCVEVTTVKNHVHNMLGKLGVRRRYDAPR
jgi:DNA-binding NarL/FixJ family response regulator